MSRLICHIIGNRPHFMKLAPVFHQLAKREVKQYIIHTGQHYDACMSSDFLAEFDLPEPNINLGIKSTNQAGFVGGALSAIAIELAQVNPDVVLVYGDTNSTLAGALAGAKQNILTAHVEAGLREGDLSIPEEVNKRAIDAVCDILFAPSSQAVDQLKKEHVLGEVCFAGDVTYDLLLSKDAEINARAGSLLTHLGISKDEPFYLATCHRAANTDSKANLEQILQAIAKLKHKVVFLIHPRTAKAISHFNLESYLNHDHIIARGSLSYLDTQALLSGCQLCITDSGGLIKEAYFHQKRAVIIDRQTEWTELVQDSGHVLTGPDSQAILAAVDQSESFNIETGIYGKGDASVLIVARLLD